MPITGKDHQYLPRLHDEFTSLLGPVGRRQWQESPVLGHTRSARHGLTVSVNPSSARTSTGCRGASSSSDSARHSSPSTYTMLSSPSAVTTRPARPGRASAPVLTGLRSARITITGSQRDTALSGMYIANAIGAENIQNSSRPNTGRPNRRARRHSLLSSFAPADSTFAMVAVPAAVGASVPTVQPVEEWTRQEEQIRQGAEHVSGVLRDDEEPGDREKSEQHQFRAGSEPERPSTRSRLTVWPSGSPADLLKAG